MKCELRGLAWLGWSEGDYIFMCSDYSCTVVFQEQGRWVMSKSMKQASSHVLRKFMSTFCCCLWREVAEFLWIPLMEIVSWHCRPALVFSFWKECLEAETALGAISGGCPRMLPRFVWLCPNMNAVATQPPLLWSSSSAGGIGLRSKASCLMAARVS